MSAAHGDITKALDHYSKVSGVARAYDALIPEALRAYDEREVYKTLEVLRLAHKVIHDSSIASSGTVMVALQAIEDTIARLDVSHVSDVLQ